MKVLIPLCLVSSLMLVTAASGNEAEQAEDVNESLLQAAVKGDVDKIKSLLLNGADVSATDKFGCI